MQSNHPPRLSPTLKIKLSVVFGSPKRSCAGNGICKMLPLDLATLNDPSCKCAVVATLCWFSNGTFTLISMDHPKTLLFGRSREGKDRFLVEEDFHFPLWLCQKVTEEKMIVPKGLYPIERNDYGEVCILGTWESTDAKQTLGVQVA